MENLRKLNEFDVLEIARERGFVVGEVVVDSQRFIKLCRVLGFKLEDFRFFIL